MNKQFLVKATRYCAIAERCRHEVSQKLQTWGADEEEIRGVLDYLEAENYLDEQRYAKAFANDKFRFEQWGKIKIGYQLRQKKIASELIKQALDQIDKQAYEKQLYELAQKKIEILQKPNLEKKVALQRYLAQKGFENDLIWRLCEQFFE